MGGWIVTCSDSIGWRARPAGATASRRLSHRSRSHAEVPPPGAQPGSGVCKNQPQTRQFLGTSSTLTLPFASVWKRQWWVQ